MHNKRHQNAALQLDSQQVARVCGGRYAHSSLKSIKPKGEKLWK